MEDDSVVVVVVVVVVFLGVVIDVRLSIEEMDSVLSLKHQWAWENLNL